ncbi:MAG: hypothetical protein V4538_01725 [Bacteroidota bacterium]
MKRIILLTAMVAALSAQVSAQNTIDTTQNDIGTWGLNLGVAVPNGDFGSMDKTSKSAGYANTGALINLNVCFQFGKKQRHGLILQYTGQKYMLNNSAYNERLETAFGGTVLLAENKGAYNFNSFGLGHNIRWKINYKHSLALRYLFYYSSFTTPGYDATFSGGDRFTNSEGSGGNLSFSLGLNYKYNLSNRVCLLADVSSQAQTIKYTTNATLTGASPATLDNSLSVSNYNLSVGVGLRIAKY